MGTHRGTSNGNVRGNTRDREARRRWLVVTFRADADVANTSPFPVPFGDGRPACRCYRCGVLLTVDTLTVDRIIPGAQGGTYRRNNIRPACPRCNSETGTRAQQRRHP